MLPISRGKDIVPIEDDKGKGKKAEGELKDLKDSLSDTKPVGDLIQLAKTIDQVRNSMLISCNFYDANRKPSGQSCLDIR